MQYKALSERQNNIKQVFESAKREYDRKIGEVEPFSSFIARIIDMKFPSAPGNAQQLLQPDAQRSE